MQAPGGGLKSAVTGTQFHQLVDASEWVCAVYVHCCAVVVFHLRKRTGPQGRCLTFLIDPTKGT